MKDEEQRLSAQYAVTRALSESASLDEATPKMLQVVCENLGWQLGALWIVERETDGLRCVETWQQPSVEVAEFETLSRERTFKRGDGLPGRVWANSEPTWVTDMADSSFPRSAVAARAGLHAAFGFPVLLGSSSSARRPSSRASRRRPRGASSTSAWTLRECERIARSPKRWRVGLN